VLAVAFVSPLCALSSALFAARTVHHVLLAAAAAPLLAWALPPATGGRATMLLAPPIFADRVLGLACAGCLWLGAVQRPGLLADAG
jgi:cytochrome c oxidase assembly factor CtaG